MADKKISQLTALSAANLAPSTDVLAIVDTSATETKKIVAQDLINGVLNVASAVGIGTASPAVKLHVAGQSRVADSSNAANYMTFGVGANAPYGNASISTTTAGLSIVAEGAGAMTFLNNGSERMRLDSSGNLGLGVTPSAGLASANYRLFEIGLDGGGSVYSGSNQTLFGTNIAWDGSTPKFKVDGYAPTLYNQQNGAHSWSTSASGTAGNTISFTQALTLDANVNLLLNGTTAPASGVGTFAIFNGTAPTGSVTNGCVLYAEDVSSSSELKVRDEAGNVTTLSPHNFSLIPEGASEDMAWAYYSEKGGKRINVDMLKLARMVEKLTGEKLVYEA